MHRRSLIAVLALSLLTLAGGGAWAEPLLWKIQAPGSTVYLFGTVHVLKPGVAWRSPKIDAAINAAGDLTLEVADADDPAVSTPLITKFGIDTASTLSSRLDPATVTRLDTLLTEYGVPPARFEPMRPWLASLMLTVLPVVKAGYDPASGADQVVKGDFRQTGKPVAGFETTEQQLRYLADLPPDKQTELLKSSIDDASKGVASLDDMVTAWAAGDAARLEASLNEDMRDSYPDLYRILIVERNARFAQDIAGLLKKPGVHFVAIGAAHLVGAQSVQVDLKTLGITATAQ